MGKQDQGPMPPSLLPSQLPDAGLEPTIYMVLPAGVVQEPRSPPASWCGLPSLSIPIWGQAENRVGSTLTRGQCLSATRGCRDAWDMVGIAHQHHGGRETAEHHRHKVRNSERAQTAARTANGTLLRSCM